MEPITRSEQYLASIIGEDVVLPIPQSRIEHYLNIIAQNGISPSSAGLINYDPEAEYPEGSMGAGLQTQAAGLGDLKSAITPYIASGMTAPAALSVGDYVMANNTLYRVIAPIANGATITPNTNVVATTEADELKRKANPNGNYPDMTVGNAEQLVATVGVEDKVPYLFRTSGGSADIGDREVDELVGGTVAWNQLAPLDLSGWTKERLTISSSGNNITLAVNSTEIGSLKYTCIPMEVNHVYAVLCSKVTNSIMVGVYSNLNTGAYDSREAISNNPINKLFKTTGSERKLTFTFTTQQTTGVTATLENFMVLDLTAMFGSTIADYIYSLEQNNAGNGVAWFRKLFPKAYYAYDAGTLMSVKTSAHKMVGFNQWDEEWEVGAINVVTGANIPDPDCIRSKNYIPVLPSTTYYVFKDTSLNFGSIRLCLYDADKGFINAPTSLANATVTMPSNAHYVRFYTRKTSGSATYDDGICLNLSWDGERDGEYEPYEAHTYALDGDLELRGIPKLDANNNIYYDGDSYEADGTVTRKYATRAYTEGDATDGSTMITDGTNTVYKLTTPTTESADPYTNPQIVNDFGTEEYVDSRDVPIPVGHDTMYQANLRAKLEMAPDSPDGDGDYIVRQSSGQNAYVPLVLPLDELPAAPDTDGTYVLKVTVASGEATYSWVSE